MSHLFDNVNCKLFARIPLPNSSLLRIAVCVALCRDMTIGVIPQTRPIGQTGPLIGGPLVMTTSHPRAMLTPEQSSVTSLNSQGRLTA